MNANTPAPESPRPSGLWAKPRSRWLLGLPAGAFLAAVVGMLIYFGTAEFMHATSSTEFCTTACHEMAAFTVPEWKASAHYKNRIGTVAGCKDCHLPEPFVPKTIRKFQALGEGWGHLIGSIATQEKYDHEKTRMARHVWAFMKSNDSRECRVCHNAATWDLEAQDKSAQKKHQKMLTSGETCIDCHKGVAHVVPPGADDSP